MLGIVLGKSSEWGSCGFSLLRAYILMGKQTEHLVVSVSVNMEPHPGELTCLGGSIEEGLS
jgi:hypothetical protein